MQRKLNKYEMQFEIWDHFPGYCEIAVVFDLIDLFSQLCYLPVWNEFFMAAMTDRRPGIMFR